MTLKRRHREQKKRKAADSGARVAEGWVREGVERTARARDRALLSNNPFIGKKLYENMRRPRQIWLENENHIPYIEICPIIESSVRSGKTSE